jgi:hypothetical protein
MTLTTLILTNAVLAATLIYALVHFLTHGIHADRRHRTSRVAELSALPERARDRIAA